MLKFDDVNYLINANLSA